MKGRSSRARRSVLVTNILPPYRLPAFEILSRMPNIELRVWLMARSEIGRPSPTTFGNLDVEIFGDLGRVIHFNPGMLWRLGHEPVDTVVLGGVDSLTTIAAAVLLKIRRVPIVFWVEDTNQQTSRLRLLLEPVISSVLRLSSAVIVPGKGATDFATRLGVSQNRIFVAPNSVNSEKFTPVTELRKEALRRKLQLPEGTLCLYVGQLIERKGILELVTAFKSVVRQFPESYLVVVGGGSLLSPLIESVAGDPTIEPRIRFVGHCPEESLPEYYAASDLFVFPTLNDVWGMVLNEAMSTGLPCVCSDRAGATLDLVEDGFTGILCKPDHEKSLEGAISHLLRDDRLRHRLGEQARARIVSNFTPTHQATGMAQAILKASEQLVESPSKSMTQAPDSVEAERQTTASNSAPIDSEVEMPERATPGTIGRILKLLLTIAFSALSLAAAVASSTPRPQGYEISIYPAYPFFFWALLVLSVSSSILALFVIAVSHEVRPRMISVATLGVLASNTFLILLPSFRGYYLGIGPTWDAMSHIGSMKHIIVWGSISEGNFYPMLHVLGAMLGLTTSLASESSGTILPVVFYILFVLSLLILAKSFTRGPATEAVTVALATPLLFSLYTRALQPSLMALFFFPLVLFLWQMRERNAAFGSRLSVLLIVCAFFLTFFHPLTALLGISVFLVFATSRARRRWRGRRERPPRLNEKPAAQAVSIALIMMVTFLTWYLSFSAVLGNMRQLVLWLAGEGNTPIALQQFQLFSTADLTLDQAAYIAINLYGPILIYLALPVVWWASRFGRQKIHSLDDRELIYQYLVQFFVSGMLSVFLLVAFSILGDIVRLLAFPLLFSIVLGGLFFGTALRVPESSRDRLEQPNQKASTAAHPTAVAIAILLVIAGGIGIMNFYGSSRTLEPNQEVTAMDVGGFNWFFAHAASYPKIYSNQRVDRFADLLFCPSKAACAGWVTTAIPPHFSYNTNTTMGDLMESENSILLTTRSDELSFLAYPEFLQPLLQSRNAHVYFSDDFNRLAADPLISKAYDNGEFEMWVARGS